MPRLKAPFAVLHASCSRTSSFDRVNFCRTVRHSWRRAVNCIFYTAHRTLHLPMLSTRHRSHAATIFHLAHCTLSSNDSADLTQSSSSVSLISSRCSQSLSLLNRLVFQEGLLPLPLLPISTGWVRSCMVYLIHTFSS